MSNSENLKKHKVLKIKRSLQKEVVDHKLDDMSGSDNEDIDFSKEIHPIGYYINDREKMIEQMFSVIKGDKLKKMLPPILKKYSLEEIKADCLVHLLGMSKKRIYAILQGRDLNSSSDSETDSTNSVLGSDSPDESQVASNSNAKSDVEEIDDTLDISVSKNDLDSLIQDKRSHSNAVKKRRDKSKTREKLAKKIKSERSPSLIEISDDEVILRKKKKDEKRSKKKIEKKPKLKHKHSKEKSKKVSSESSDESSDKDVPDGSIPVDSKKGKSLLEILELEMRARAIRALLEAAPNVVDSVSASAVDVKSELENKTKGSVEKETVPVDTQEDENVDDSLDVVEIVNDNSNEDAIIILDDIDEEIILESDNEPEAEPEPQPTEKEAPKNAITSPPKTDTTTENDLTWPQRWAESKGVKEIIQNSKLCANIRKRMRFARMLKQKQALQQETTVTENPLISELNRAEEGSVDQLQILKLIDETKNKPNENSKQTNKPEIISDEPTTAECSQDNEKDQPQDNENDETLENDRTPVPKDKENVTKSISDVEIVEKNIECHIDLTDA